MALSSDEVRKLREELEASGRAQEKLQTSVKGMAGLYSDSLKLSQQLVDIKVKNAKAQERINELIKKGGKNGKNLSDGLKHELAIRQKIGKENDETIRDYEKQLKLLKKQRRSLANISSAIGGSINTGLKKSFNWYQKFDKAARSTAVSMGITGKNVDKYRKSLNQVAIKTADIGVSYEGLAKMQNRYSDNLGRAVMLSDKGSEAISQIAQGTLLGAEGAADLAANMDMFGMSVIAARDRVQETVDLASDMGLNSSKVVKIMQNNLKLANKYNFKDGTKNMMKMAAMTAKFKLEMSSVATMAEKLFEPEGAIEMAANLQVLGGEFSKMADPFKLMFQARNDMEGLQETIIKSTASLATFNKESGEFNVSAQELHRLRKVAEATGLPLEQLTETAREYAKVNMAKKDINFKIDKKDEDFITSAAQWSKEKNGFAITIFNKDGTKTEKLIKDLDSKTLEFVKNEKQTLKERAREAQNLTDVWGNLLTKLGTSLLPLLQGLDNAMREPIIKFVDYLNKTDIITKLQKFGGKIGDSVNKLSQNIMGIIDGTKTFGDVFSTGLGKFTTIAGGLLAGKWLYDTGKWLYNGFMLSQGFLKGTRGFGGGGTTPGGLSFKKDGKNPKGKGPTKYDKPNIKGNKGFKGGIKNGGLKGGALALGGLTLDYGNQAMIDAGLYGEGSGWDKGLSTGASIASWAGTGSMIGSMFGPIGTTVGGIVGGVIGLGKGVYDNYINTPDKKSVGAGYDNPYGKSLTKGTPMTNVNDFIFSEKEGLINFSKNDTVVGAEKNGPIDKMVGGGNGTPSNLTVNFKTLKIEFSPIEIKTNGKSLSTNDFETNPQLVRELSSMIQGEIRKAIGGGKLSPNVL